MGKGILRGDAISPVVLLIVMNEILQILSGKFPSVMNAIMEDMLWKVYLWAGQHKCNQNEVDATYDQSKGTWNPPPRLNGQELDFFFNVKYMGVI